MALTLAAWVSSQPGMCVNMSINSGCVGWELGVGGEVWAGTMVVLVFPTQMHACICICDTVQRTLPMSV